MNDCHQNAQLWDNHALRTYQRAVNRHTRSHGRNSLCGYVIKKPHYNAEKSIFTTVSSTLSSFFLSICFSSLKSLAKSPICLTLFIL